MGKYKGNTPKNQSRSKKIKETLVSNFHEKDPELIKRFLPKIQEYIVRRLNMAYATGALSKGDIPATEIVNMVYLEMMERSGTIPLIPKKLEIALFKVADETLAKALEEIRFEKEHFLTLHRFENREILEMEEKFTIDADGDLIMIEELDEVSYQSKQYDPEAVFLMDEEAPMEIENILRQYDKVFIQQIIRKLLVNLAERERTVFDLFWLEGMDLDQIATIRRIPEDEVASLLKKVTLCIKEGLERRLKSRQ
ncbi:MAG: hypothetical protein WD398_09070 [Cyclobacteriaceae bacterium]